MKHIGQTSFDINEKELLTSKFKADNLDIINNITDKWHVDNTMNIMSFLDKTSSFEKYMYRYLETSDEENFIFVEGLYDNLLVHSKKV